MVNLEKRKMVKSTYLNRRQIWRKQKNWIVFLLSMLAMFFSLFWLTWILFTILIKGIKGISWNLFIEMTPPPNSFHGGLANAIVGSFLLIFFATIFSIPIGLMVGVYLAEYGRNSWFAELIRFINSLMLSSPSILIGLFVYNVFVLKVHHFSGWAGIIALSLLQIPIIIQNTENMLKFISNDLREAARAIGTPKWKTIILITLKLPISGIATGVLLSIARISGETGPLLFTSFSNQFWNVNLNEPIATLPLIIFKFSISPFFNWQKLAWSGVLLITLFILLINILINIFLVKKNVNFR